MKRLIKASITKKSYYYNYGSYDPYEVYDNPTCIDKFKIDEKWLTEAIEYYKNAIRKYPDINSDEFCDLLDEGDYYGFDPKNDYVYSMDIDMDYTSIIITGYGHGKEKVITDYDSYSGEHYGYDLDIDIHLEAKYSIEEFMQKTPQSIIDDLYNSLTYEFRNAF